MNLIILQTEDFIGPGLARLTGRRLEHLRDVLRATPGKCCKVGLLNGRRGSGELLRCSAEAAELAVTLNSPPPAPPACKLVIALPRPQTLKKVLHAGITIGVKEFHFIHCFKVEKSYWSSPRLQPEALSDDILAALEQSGDTLTPAIAFHRSFKPFVEDALPAILAGTTALVAHPYTDNRCPGGLEGPVSLVLGPEGGFTDYEVDRLTAAGCRPVRLGARILRTEVALPVLLGRLGVF